MNKVTKTTEEQVCDFELAVEDARLRILWAGDHRAMFRPLGSPFTDLLVVLHQVCPTLSVESLSGALEARYESVLLDARIDGYSDDQASAKAWTAVLALVLVNSRPDGT